MLLEINFTTVLFAISFLIFIYLLNLTLYKPVGKVIENRKSLIDGEYTKAKEYAESANKLLEGYKEKIKSTRLSTQNIIQEAISEAEKKRGEKVLSLSASLVKEKEGVLKQVREEEKIALKSLEDKIKALTDLIISKIVGGLKSLASTH